MKNCAAFSFSYRMEILMTTYKWRSTHISTHVRYHFSNIYCRKNISITFVEKYRTFYTHAFSVAL